MSPTTRIVRNGSPRPELEEPTVEVVALARARELTTNAAERDHLDRRLLELGAAG